MPAFIALLIGVLSFQAFSLTYQLSGIKRSIINMPKSIVEICVEKQKINNVITFYINDNLLEQNCNNYFDLNLKKYTSSYEIIYNYYIALTNRVCIPSNLKHCDGVTITLNCKIMTFLNYSETMFFEIQENK